MHKAAVKRLLCNVYNQKKKNLQKLCNIANNSVLLAPKIVLQTFREFFCDFNHKKPKNPCGA